MRLQRGRSHRWLQQPLLALLLALVLALSACGGGNQQPQDSQTGTPSQSGGQTDQPSQPSQDAKRGGTLRVAVANEPDTLDPHRSAAGPDRNMLFQIYDSLLRFDKNLNVVPGQVKEWKTPDDLTFEFTLNEGLKFHDGTDLNAQAVVWNFDRMMNKDLNLVPYSDLLDVEKVEAVDNLTFRIRLKQPLAPLLALLSDRAGMMISPAAYEKHGPDNYGRNPVGAGPFEFVEWRQGDSVTLKRYDGFFEEGKPYLDQVVFRVIPDAAVRTVGLQSGDLDLLADVPPVQVITLKTDPNVQVLETDGLAWGYLMFNVTKPPFDNVKVRQALAWALDRQAIVDAILEGAGSPGQGPFSPSSWAFDSSLDNYYGYNPDKARQLLAEAGFGPNNPLKFTMLTTTDPTRTRQTEMVQAYLKDIGVEAQIQPYELATTIENMRNGTYEVISLYFSGRVDPDGNAFMRWHSKGTLNYMRYNNPEMDQLLEASRRSYDPKERAEIFKQVNRVMLEDLPLAFINSSKSQMAARKMVQGFVQIPDNMVRLWDTWLQT